MTYDGAVLAELGRVECDNTPSLQFQPGQLWWEGELKALGLHKKKNKKSKGALENRRKNYWIDILTISGMSSGTATVAVS